MGKISESYFADGDKVTKGQLLVKFDTRQASEQLITLKNMIESDKKQLKIQLSSLVSQVKTPRFKTRCFKPAFIYETNNC